MSKKVLIVGGVAGGASAAARLRRLVETAEIVIFERGEYISFANCGLPYYIGEQITERDMLILQTPEAMKARFNLDVRVESEVVQIDTKNKKVTVNSRNKGTYEESYDALILSPGAKPIKPGIPGIDSDKIFALRNIRDTDKIKEYVDQENISSAIVIGGGFIGIEMAENLRERGLEVSLVEAAPHILAPFDSDMVVLAEKELSNHGIPLYLGDGVTGFENEKDQIKVLLQSKTTLKADMVILAIGVTPDTGFLKDTEIELGPKGHIVVNDKLQTAADGVYAVGDAIEVIDYVTKQRTAIPLAGPANKQGRMVADIIAGIDRSYKGTQGTSILKVFDLTAASTGANERTLKRLSIPYHAIHIHPASHASYYPGATQMTLKLIFHPDGRVLGAQGIGFDGVDKRIDVIATVIGMNGNVQDLTELELAYAPPFSSAKDPVNMAGFVAQNILEGRSNLTTWDEVNEMSKEDYQLLDVRTSEEYANGHEEGAINIPVDELRDRLGELDQSKVIVEYCRVGVRGHVADRILSQNGFQVKNVTGGVLTADSLKFDPIGARVNILKEHQDKNKEMVNSKTMNKNSINNESISSTTNNQEATSKDTMKEDAVVRAASIDTQDIQVLDARGLCCPGPLMRVKTTMDQIEEGQLLKVLSTDQGFYEDIKSWSLRTNNEIVSLDRKGGTIEALLRKGASNQSVGSTGGNMVSPARDNKTMVVFSGDLDKAIASFIIANGAVAMGKKVTMFFTFWGLNILRKPEKVKVNKGVIDKMFGIMMPQGSKRLKMSKMNMMGMGGAMIRKVMKNKNISSLEELIQSAMDAGVEVVACQMSMDVMGLKKEELLDGVKIGGVGYYLGEAEDSNVNLFI